MQTQQTNAKFKKPILTTKADVINAASRLAKSNPRCYSQILHLMLGIAEDKQLDPKMRSQVIQCFCASFSAPTFLPALEIIYQSDQAFVDMFNALAAFFEKQNFKFTKHIKAEVIAEQLKKLNLPFEVEIEMILLELNLYKVLNASTHQVLINLLNYYANNNLVNDVPKALDRMKGMLVTLQDESLLPWIANNVVKIEFIRLIEQVNMFGKIALNALAANSFVLNELIADLKFPFTKGEFDQALRKYSSLNIARKIHANLKSLLENEDLLIKTLQEEIGSIQSDREPILKHLLILVIGFKKPILVEMLLGEGVVVDKSVMTQVGSHGNADIAKLVLAAQKESKTDENPNEHLLLCALMTRNVEIVEFALNSGISFDVVLLEILFKRKTRDLEDLTKIQKIIQLLFKHYPRHFAEFLKQTETHVVIAGGLLACNLNSKECHQVCEILMNGFNVDKAFALKGAVKLIGETQFLVALQQAFTLKNVEAVKILCSKENAMRKSQKGELTFVRFLSDIVQEFSISAKTDAIIYKCLTVLVNEGATLSESARTDCPKLELQAQAFSIDEAEIANTQGYLRLCLTKTVTVALTDFKETKHADEPSHLVTMWETIRKTKDKKHLNYFVALVRAANKNNFEDAITIAIAAEKGFFDDLLQFESKQELSGIDKISRIRFNHHEVCTAFKVETQMFQTYLDSNKSEKEAFQLIANIVDPAQVKSLSASRKTLRPKLIPLETAGPDTETYTYKS